MNGELRRDKTAATEGSAYMGSFYCAMADLPVPPDTEVVLVRADRYDSLEAIVRDLADGSTTCWSSGGDWHSCALCDAPLPASPEDHDPRCPWRRAVEWVSTQETT